MNGQQLTNSSNSANGTPSSSYPGSISSQSSRDVSPATQQRKPLPEPYNHVNTTQPNHWPSKEHPLLQTRPQTQDMPSQPLSNFHPPISLAQPASQSNHLPQPSSSPSPVQPPEPSTLQTSNHPTFPTSAADSFTPNQFQKMPSQQFRPTQPPPISQQPTLAPQHQSRFSLPPSQSLQSSNQIPPSQSLQSSNQIPPAQNKFPTPLNQSSQAQQPQYSNLSQPNNAIPSQFSNQPQPPSKITPQYSNQSQPPSVIPPGYPNQPQPPGKIPPQYSNQPKPPSTIPPQYSNQPQPPSKIPPGYSNQPQPPPQYSNQPQPPSIPPPQSSNQPQPPSIIPPGYSNQPQPPSIPPPQYSNQPQPPSIIPPGYSNQPRPPITTPPQYSNHPQSSSVPPPKFPNKPAPPSMIPNQYPNQPQPPSIPPPQYSNLPQPPSMNFPQSNNQQALPQPQSQFFKPPNQTSQLSNHYSPPPQQQVPTSQPQHSPAYPAYPQTQQAQNQFNKRYPAMPGFQQQPNSVDGLTQQVAGMTVQQGFNKLWGMDTVDLLKCRDLLPREKVEPPHVRLQHELYEAANCNPEIFRCTLSKIPETKSLLDKSRLPLGVLIHPFKDLNQLSVIQCTVIVRCRVCRTYINPFVYFVDNKRWKCNLCFRVNELPEEFQFDPMTKTYGDPSRRPEIKSATIEFIAPSEYMVRPPQPAVYVYLLDVSRLACECGYLDAVCRTLLAELDNLPGDARTSIAFITFDSAVHFYSLAEGQGQPHQMTVVDIEDMFLPTPDNLLANLSDCRDLIRDLLEKLPTRYKESYDTHSALGAALQAAYKLLAPTGGRVTVFQSCLPNAGPGALSAREDPAQRAGDNPPHLNPSTDFYKKLALECSGQQIAVDLFLVNSQYLDLATLSGVSRFSGGCMYHVPLYRSDKPMLVESLERMFQRYLTRKIGFESVMRLRCTRGLSIHTFHGNFFVRSTDLLSLPNANPDAGFGMQVTIEENLADVQNICFQAALLYTSSKGERRIRVHTLCLPVASNLADILHSADQQCIVGLLSKMAADRAVQSSLSDAREAFVNVVGDVLSAFRLTQSSNTTGCLLAPANLKLLPLYILALLKHVAFRVGQSTRLDDRVFAMCQMKSLPLALLMQSVYPDLYPLLNIESQPEAEIGDSVVPQPPRLQLSAERIDSLGYFLMDDGCSLLVYVGHNLNPAVCQAVFNVPHFSAIPQELFSLPELENPISDALRSFISYLQNEKPYPVPLQVIRDDSHYRTRFLERLIEDKNESGTSYYEFLQRVKTLVK